MIYQLKKLVALDVSTKYVVETDCLRGLDIIMCNSSSASRYISLK